MNKYHVEIEYEGTNKKIERKEFYVVAPHLCFEKALEIVADAVLRARLEAAKKWQRHDLLCGVEMSEGKLCTCGLSEHQKGE